MIIHTLSFLLPTSPKNSGDALSNLSPDELAEIGRNPEMLVAVRAEVNRRLKDSALRANSCVFRWLSSTDESDKTDAFDGLIATSWNAVAARQSVKEDSPDKTREDIMNELVDQHYELRNLPQHEVVRRALNEGFNIDVDVANAVRRRLRAERSFWGLHCQKDNFELLMWAYPRLEIGGLPGPRKALRNRIEELKTELASLDEDFPNCRLRKCSSALNSRQTLLLRRRYPRDNHNCCIHPFDS